MKPMFKRLMAGAAAAATLLSGLAITAPALAAGTDTQLTPLTPTTKQTLTVTAENGALTGHTLVAVELAKYTSYSKESVTIDGTAKDLVSGYDVTTPDALKTAIYDAANSNDVQSTEQAAPKPGETDTRKAELTKDNPMTWVVQNLLDSDTSPYAGNLRNFLTHLSRNTTVTDAAGTTLIVADDGNSATTPQGGVEPGVYAILDKTTDKDEQGNDKSASITMLTGTQFEGLNLKGGTADTPIEIPLGTIEYKPITPTITKKIVENDQDVDANTAAGHETVEFKLTTDVPNWTGYDTYFLSMEDTLSKGLTLDGGYQATIAQKKTDGTYDTAQNLTQWNDGTATGDYKVTTSKPTNAQGQATGETGIQFLFAPQQGKNADGTGKTDTAGKAVYDDSDIIKGDLKNKYTVDARIVVTYKAHLNANAVIAGTGNPNTVRLQYSNNPNNAGHGLSAPSEVKTYTGAFKLHKTDAAGKDLTGAKFKIFRKNETTPIKFTGSNGTYMAVKSDEQGSQEITMDKATVTFKGLDGEYTVKETLNPLTNKDPNLSFDITITVTKPQAPATDATYTVATRGDLNNLVTAPATGADATADQKVTVTVKNVRNLLEMPKTGATWLVIYAVAALLLASGSFLLLRSRRA